MDPSLSRDDIAFSSRVVRATSNLIMISHAEKHMPLFSWSYTWFHWFRGILTTPISIFLDRSTYLSVPTRGYLEFYAMLLRHKWHQEWETSSDHAFPIFFLCEKLRLSAGISHFAPRTTIAPISRSSLRRGYTSTHPYSCMENALVYTTAALLNA